MCPYFLQIRKSLAVGSKCTSLQEEWFLLNAIPLWNAHRPALWPTVHCFLCSILLASYILISELMSFNVLFIGSSETLMNQCSIQEMMKHRGFLSLQRQFCRPNKWFTNTLTCPVNGYVVFLKINGKVLTTM